MSRLSILAPVIRFEKDKCSLPVHATTPAKLTSVESLLDTLCLDDPSCDACPFYRLFDTPQKLTP